MTNDQPSISDLYKDALEDFAHDQTYDATEKLKKVIELDPRHEDAYEALSVIYYNSKRYDEAITTLKKWVSVNPHVMMAHTNLSRCYVAKDMIAEAEREQAIAQEIAWKLELKDKKQSLPVIDYEAKIEQYQEIIKLDPKDVLGYFSLGKTYLDKKDYANGVKIFQQAIEVNPMHSSSYMYLGNGLEELGQKDAAIAIYEKGIEVSRMLGDMMPEKKMEARLRGLKRKS